MYSLDRREVAKRVYSLLGSLRKTSYLLNVHFSTISRWLKNPERKQYKRKSFLKTDTIIEFIKTAIQNNPFTSIRILVNIIHKSLEIKVSRELVRVVLQKLNFTRKKAKPSFIPKHYPEKVEQFINVRKNIQSHMIVSIDETAFSHNQKELRGYSKKGSKLYFQKKQLYGKNISVLACASEKGWVHKKQIFGSFNSISFATFIKELQMPKDTTILLDNVSFHKSKIVKEAAEDKGFNLLFVPPYSPWFNPIEMCFSIVKRKYYETQNIDDSFDCLQTHHFDAFFRKSLNCNERF